MREDDTITLYIIRVLQIELDDDGYRYHQMETNEKYGPFPSLPSMLGHIHDRMLEDITEALERRYN